MKKTIVPIFLAIIVIGGITLWKSKLNVIPKEEFAAPGKEFNSPKKVEDYFVEKLRFTQSDLERQKNATKVSFRPGKGSTVDAIISNLHYYGFIKSERALRYALENTEDRTQANPGALWIGNNGSIDTNAVYEVSEDMTAWQMADTLLNKSHYFGENDEYGYLFMP